MAGQFEFADRTLAPLAASLDLDRPLLVTHGNGPQVGYILTRVEEALGKAYALPPPLHKALHTRQTTTAPATRRPAAP